MEGKYAIRRKLFPKQFGCGPYRPKIELDVHGAKISRHLVYLSQSKLIRRQNVNFTNMETINWQVEGMSCSNCALTIGKFLEKEGLQNVKVSLMSGDVSFDSPELLDQDVLRKGIRNLGYRVKEAAGTGPEKSRWNVHLRYVLICLPFSLLLVLPMLLGWLMPGRVVNMPVSGSQQPMVAGGWLGELTHWLMNPWVQLGLCLPVYVTGMNFFGRSAIHSLRNHLPNMNVLITIGATAAFIYSLAGTIFSLGPGYMFYETAALIITLVFLGYYVEDMSIRTTQRALDGLARSQKVMANMIAFDEDHQELIFPVENINLRSGDLILIRSGEQVPADCKILWGEAGVNEAIITGESMPVSHHAKELLVGGSLLVSGTVKAQVTAAAKDSVLSNIINLVKRAQGEKPPVQQLADRISAVFVPIVLGLAAVCLLGNFLYFHAFTPALIRSIAVLVIACPCAMGLATPAAIAVGLGRAARMGVLFRNARSLESFRNIGQIVFDKTGTLTTGNFAISGWQTVGDGTLSIPMTPDAFKQIVFSLEKYSSHPLAIFITREWRQKNDLRWAKIEEVKGMGMRAESGTGDVYWAGSYKIAAHLTNDHTHTIYVVSNDRLLGWIDLEDTIRPEAPAVISWLHGKGIRTLLLSGDRDAICRKVAAQVGIEEVISEQSPSQKLEMVASLNAAMPTAMVGDGINDAPALAKAAVGISMSDASQLAMQTADVVLMNHGLKQLPAALGLGRHTFLTIRENLFWAFLYNGLAIPIAAFGLLTPTIAALAMGFSDIVLVINSVRLFVKKVV
jgi:Cu+-exporting ATPase